MSALVTINNIEVEFINSGDEIFITSLQVAEVFEKRHADTIRAIENLPDDDFRRRNFAFTERTAKFGAVVRSEPYYNLTKDGFSLLVMGFTGEKAYKFKVAYINAFNKMEAMLREKSEPLSEIDLLIHQAKILKENQQKLKSLEVKTDGLEKEQLKTKHNINRLLNNDNYMTVIAYANLKGIPAKKYNASALGRKATNLSKKLNLAMGAVIDPRFDSIKTYNVEILSEVFRSIV
ncbi:Rha family transcriptional regulator [Campylobacter corcagiensis]|uniref:Rha family transcriptional regulator n=1 Tax=Campylobacter corcagiensis TaxID=1448857 RepID=A0A7M1LFE3_9BACT|nr:Rha family transcriptional regulator [Campylobacter corcagiensis]QKF64516.1 phage regulatory protein, Rha family [Campylobacter corcagiensis]QOQ87307.1 Rha family transcriptional regulator [Campylobacter corcagiensis]